MIDVTLDRPRQRNDPQFLALRAEILELLHFAGEATPRAGRDESRPPWVRFDRSVHRRDGSLAHEIAAGGAKNAG